MRILNGAHTSLVPYALLEGFDTVKSCVDDEKMKPIYKKISSLGLITVFHSGDDYGYAPPYHCMPDNLLNALKWFDSPVVAAHWGGVSCGVEVIEKLCGSDLYFDLSFGYGAMPRAVPPVASTSSRIVI